MEVRRSDEDDGVDASGAAAPADADRVGATAALANPTFRRMFIGAFGSNIGTWMQNAVLGALALDLTNDARFVGLLIFAQLSPMIAAPIGGLAADTFDRRRLLIGVISTQAILAAVLGQVVRDPDPNRTAMLAVVFCIGIGQSVFMPTYGAVLPDLVGRKNLAGAVSLNSTSMNLSRVVGPPIGAFLYATYGAVWVFSLNAATYGFILVALVLIRLPDIDKVGGDESPLRRLTLGFRIARGRHAVGRSLSVMMLFALLCLPFIGQMPTVAARNFGIAPDSTGYGVLYGCFGIGAMLGAASIGTVFARTDMARLVRLGLGSFAVVFAVFSWLRSPTAAYAVIIAVGFCYFGTVTALSTAMQENVTSGERGRVMALWAMAFGGSIPVGNLVAGPLMEATSVTTVIFPGAVIAVGLAAYADLRPRPETDAMPFVDDEAPGPAAA